METLKKTTYVMAVDRNSKNMLSESDQKKKKLYFALNQLSLLYTIKNFFTQTLFL